ncbi:MAG: flagellar FliJ family protein [Bacteriovoracaceae bacterium]|nr:flagellar FliJ family protein [Bacteriovoracaceae bacterium]
MKKFNFKLQGLQRFRAFKEDKIKIELGEIVSRMNNLKGDNARLDKDIGEAFENQNKLVSEMVGGSILHFFQYYINGKRETIRENKEKLKQLRVEYEEKTVELSQAMGEVKVIDSIRKRNYAEYKKYYNKTMQNDIEDILRMRKENRGE